jgi:hypothetical protein
MPDRSDNPGGGSGGGPDTQTHYHAYDGPYSIAANQVEFLSRDPLPPASASDCTISMVASSITTLKGSVNLRGMAGVRLTSGPPVALDTISDSTDGIELQAHELQKVTIKRGLVDDVDQLIEMTSSGITVDGGSQPVTVKSIQKITLSVAEGASTVELTPESIKISFGFGMSTISLGMDGITIQGLPLVKIN